MKNYYRILNINSTSNADDIKAAYRKLAKEHHPDRGGDSAHFNDIQEAYDTLSDPGRRDEYDRYRWQRPFAGEPYRISTPPSRPQPMDVFDDAIDVLTRKFGLESELLYDVDIILSPDEAANGINLELSVPIERICDSCFGFGGTLLSDCGRCGGGGMLRGTGMVHVSIGPGARDGDTVMARSGGIVIRGIIEVSR